MGRLGWEFLNISKTLNHVIDSHSKFGFVASEFWMRLAKQACYVLVAV